MFITAVLSIAVLVVLVGSLAVLSSGENRAVPFWSDGNAAYYVAESGLEHCRWKLQYEEPSLADGEFGVTPPSFTSDSEPESRGFFEGPASYEVWVRPDPEHAAERLVTVVGHYAARSYRLDGRLAKIPMFTEGAPPEDLPPPPDFGGVEDIDGLDYIKVTSEDFVLDDSYQGRTWQYTQETEGGERTYNCLLYVVDYVSCEGNCDLIVGTWESEGPGAGQDFDIVYILVREFIYAGGGGTVNVGGDDGDPKIVFIMMPDAAKNQYVTVSGGTIFNGYIWAGDVKTKILGTSTVVFGDIEGTDVTINGATYYADESAHEILWPDPIWAAYEVMEIEP